MQNQVASAIALEIKIKVTPQEEARLASARPVNLEAHEALPQGPLPDHRLLNDRCGVRFGDQDLEHLQSLPAGIVGRLELVAHAAERSKKYK